MQNGILFQSIYINFQPDDHKILFKNPSQMNFDINHTDHLNKLLASGRQKKSILYRCNNRNLSKIFQCSV